MRHAACASLRTLASVGAMRFVSPVATEFQATKGEPCGKTGMRFWNKAGIAILFVIALSWEAGCGGGSGSTFGPPPNPVPSVTSLSPSSATVGAAAQTMTINGSGFLQSSTVTYNGVAHPATFVSSGQLTIQLSASDEATAGTYALVVTNPPPGGGASVSVTFNVDNPAPTVSSISPTVIAAGAPDTVITINGDGFVSTSTVGLNGLPLTTTVVSSTQLTVTLPAASLASAATDQITVATPGPGGGTSASASLAVTAVASLVILATPQNGGPTDGPWQVVVAAAGASGNSIANLPITLTSTDGTLDLAQGQTDSSGTFLATISPPGTNTGQAVAVTAATGAQTAVVDLGFVASPSAPSAPSIAREAFSTRSDSTSLSSGSTPLFGPMVYGISGTAGSTSQFGTPSNCLSNVGLTQLPSSACQTTLNASGILYGVVNTVNTACNGIGTFLGNLNCAGTALSVRACLAGNGALALVKPQICAGAIYYFGKPCLTFVATQLATQYGGPLAGLLMKAGLSGLGVALDGANPSDIITFGCLAVNAASFGLGTGPSGTQVTVSPPRAVVPLGGTQQFTSNTSVNWSVVQGPMGGSITSTGLYTAPTTMPFLSEVTVDATSTADSQAVAQEEVTLVNSTGGGSGSTAIIAGLAGGQMVDKAYVPVPNSYLVSVVNVDASPDTNPVVATIPTPNSYSPNATAANPTTQQVVVVSYTSADVQIIDASNDQLVATLPSGVTGEVSFSGGSCVICGVAIDPTSNTAILDTAQGYLLLDMVTRQFSPFVAGSYAGENFAYNPNGRTILNPVYDQSLFNGLQAIHLNDNSVWNFSGTIGSYLDSAAVDIATNIAVVPDEYTGNEYMVNMAQAVFTDTDSTFSAPISMFPITFPDCYDEFGQPNDWTYASIESSTHNLFIADEFGSCAAVQPLPTSVIADAPPLPAVFKWGHMPSAPDLLGWNNGADPHGIAVFTSVVDGKPYGFLVRKDQVWVARIDMLGVISASPIAGGLQGEIDLAPFVTFYNTQ